MVRFLIGLLLTVSIIGCTNDRSLITIVDIEHHDRIALGKQIRAIQKYNPKIIALDILLYADSLEVDSVLVNTLNKSYNIVHVVDLEGGDVYSNEWDSLHMSHDKFHADFHGFGNITADESIFGGYIIDASLHLRQLHQREIVKSFSYVIAEQTFGVKDEYKTTGLSEVIFPDKIFSQRFKTITFPEITSGDFNKADIEGKIVILGYVGAQDEDAYYLNFLMLQKISGVEAHACIVQQLIDVQ